MYPFVL